MKSISFPLAFLSLSTVLLSSCSLWKKEEPALSTSSVIERPETVASKSIGHIQPEVKLPITKILEFDVDPARTTGRISLAIDPKGSVLGVRKAHADAPLKGTMKVKLIEDPNTGKTTMAILDMHLTNTRAYDMNFAWGGLVGSMNVNIATGVLKIVPNDFSSTGILGTDKKFNLPRCYFTVLGHSQVKGKGLVLKKAVGNKKVNLTMKKTEPVDLKGSIDIQNGTGTLHIPSAVLRDHFDLDGTQLDLVFTADITATAQNL